MAEKEIKMHPLHSIQRITEHMETTGTYIGERRTGRSTAAALRLMSETIKLPFKWMVIKDHAGSEAGYPPNAADRGLMQLLYALIAQLGFEHFDIDEKNFRIRFGKDPSKPYVR